MPIIKRVSQSSRKVLSSRSTQVDRLEELSDTNFGALDTSKDGLVVTYDNTQGKFVLSTPDQILETSSEDNDLPDQFITQLESEINLQAVLDDPNIDGGSF